MLTGIGMAIIAGCLSTVVGIAMSHLAKNKTGIYGYYILNAFLTILLCIIFLVKFSTAENTQNGLSLSSTGIYVIGSGILSALGTLLLQSAMQYGHNGLAWAICQSAMILPFMAGVFFFGQKASSLNFIGLSVITTGIFLGLGSGDNQEKNQLTSSKWFILSLSAFVMLGSSMTLCSIPSYQSNISDNYNIRPAMIYIGFLIGILLISLVKRKANFGFSVPVCILATAMAFINVVILKMLFGALDTLAAYGMASIVYPLCIGTAILGFSVYSILIMKEKSDYKAYAGAGGIITGMLLISAK